MLARAEEIGEEVNGCIGRKRERESLVLAARMVEK